MSESGSSEWNDRTQQLLITEIHKALHVIRTCSQVILEEVWQWQRLFGSSSLRLHQRNAWEQAILLRL